MAINFLNNVDYNQNQLFHPTIENQGSDALAGTPVEGQLYYNTTDNVLKVGKEVGATTPPTYQWAAVSSSYGFTLSDSASPAITGSISSGDTVKIAANADLTSNLTGQATTAKTLTVGLKVDGGVGVSDNYVVNQGSATAAADDTIPFNNYTDAGTPATSTDVVKKTTFGDIPVEALTLVKTYIDDSVAGGLIYQGGYNASTNTPNLDDNPNPNPIKKGWTYTVTADGLFFTEQVRVGDVLIAESDAPTALADWTTVQNNVDLASDSQVGIGNVKAATAALAPELDGLSVTYSSGTATVGLDINGLSPVTTTDDDSSVAIYDNANGINKKIELGDLAPVLNSFTSYAETITDTDTITHGLGTKDVIIQLYDVTTDETVYADVDRISTTQATITFASTPTNSIRVLVQKIG